MLLYAKILPRTQSFLAGLLENIIIHYFVEILNDYIFTNTKGPQSGRSKEGYLMGPFSVLKAVRKWKCTMKKPNFSVRIIFVGKQE
jgi:hypothetical protein